MNKVTNISAQLEILKAKYAQDERRRSAMVEAEMIRLVRKAGCQQQVIALAKQIIEINGGDAPKEKQHATE